MAMTLVRASEINMAICRALKLDPHKVKTLTLYLDHRGTRLSVEMLMSREDGVSLAGTLEDCEMIKEEPSE